MITEETIVRVATMLNYDLTEEEIHDNLISLGLSEYDIFLAYHAGKTYNLISSRTYEENGN